MPSQIEDVSPQIHKPDEEVTGTGNQGSKPEFAVKNKLYRKNLYIPMKRFLTNSWLQIMECHFCVIKQKFRWFIKKTIYCKHTQIHVQYVLRNRKCKNNHFIPQNIFHYNVFDFLSHGYIVYI